MTSEDPAADAPDGGPAAAPGGGEPVSGRHEPGAGWLARSGNLEYDRVLFFSDAIFAIAITLLALDLRVPAASSQSGHVLRAAVPGITSFAISFAVIGLFWLAHHSIFRYIIAFDRPLILLNLLFLGTIAFLPYPTNVLGLTSTSQAPAVIFYAACCSATGLVEVGVWLYATRPGSGLAAPAVAQVRLPYLLQAARVPAVFLLSIPVALFSPTVASLMWILILVVSLVLNRLVPPDRTKEPVG